MGTTPKFSLPYPEPTSSVDVPRDIKALALATDTQLAALSLPSVTVSIEELASHGGGERDIRFQSVVLDTGVGASVDASGFLSLTLTGLYFVNISSTCYASAAWGGSMVLVNVGGTVPIVAITVSALNHQRMNDLRLARHTAGAKYKVHINTAGQAGFITNELTAVRVAP